jgi:hypothetical protein
MDRRPAGADRLGVLTGSAVLFSLWVGGLPAGVEKLYQAMPEKLVFNSANTPVFIDNILSWTFAEAELLGWVDCTRVANFLFRFSL